MKRFKLNGKNVSLTATTYRNNGTLAVIVKYPKGEEDVVTVNLNSRFQSDSMAFLDVNNKPWIEKFLRDNELGMPMYVNEQSGFVKYPLWTIFTEAFK